MFETPEGARALDGGNDGEFIRGRRRRCSPLRGPGAPRAAPRRSSSEVRPHEIRHENDDTQCLKENADGYDEIPHVPASAWFISVDSSRHTKQAGNVHEVKCQVEPDEEKPEMQLT